MPSAKAAMYAALSADDGVKAVVQSRVYPDQAAQEDVEPYLVFQVIADIQPKSFRGKNLIRQTRFQLTGICETRLQAETLATALENLLDAQSYTNFGGLLVKSSLISTDEGAVDDDESPRPGAEFGDRTVRMDVTWWH